MVYCEIRAARDCRKETTMSIVMFYVTDLNNGRDYNVTDLNNGRDYNVCENKAQGLFLYHSYEMAPRELMGVE